MDNQESKPIQHTAIISPVDDSNDDTMDRAFHYLSRHGLVAVALIHATYRALRLSEAYASGDRLEFEYTLRWPFLPFTALILVLEGNEAAFSLPLPMIGWRLPIYRTDIATRKKIKIVSFIIILYLSLLVAVTWLLNAARTLPGRIGMTMATCWSATLPAAFRSVPFLIGLLVLLFSTGDTWRLYGAESNHRFVLLVILIGALSIAAMAMAVTRAKGGWRKEATQQNASNEDISACALRTPVHQLVRDHVKPFQISDEVYAAKWLRINIYILFWFTLIAHLFSVALLVFLTFMLIGMIAVSAATTKMLLGGGNAPVDTLWRIPVWGESFIMTRPLLILSVLFGCVAALTYATVSLQDDEGLERFLNFSLQSYRQSFSALRYYLGAIAVLQQNLPWKRIIAQLEENNRAAILKLLDGFIAKSGPRVITAVLDIARRNYLTEWAADHGIDILASVPHDRLAVLSTEDVQFVLEAAATDPAKAAAIQNVRDGLSGSEPLKQGKGLKNGTDGTAGRDSADPGRTGGAPVAGSADDLPHHPAAAGHPPHSPRPPPAQAMPAGNGARQEEETTRLTTAGRPTPTRPAPPSRPRLRLQPDLSARTLLDGGWWPRSADPAAELPGLILAIEKRHGPITRIMLGQVGWDASQPRRLRVDGPAGSRVVRLGWFETMPAGLLIAIARAGRTDLLTVPPHTGEPAARAAMEQAAQASNRTHTPALLAAAAARPAPHRTASS